LSYSNKGDLENIVEGDESLTESDMDNQSDVRG